MSKIMNTFQNNMDVIVTDLQGHSEDLYKSMFDLDSLDAENDEFKFTLMEEAPDGSGELHEFEFDLLNTENRSAIASEIESQADDLAHARCMMVITYHLLSVLHQRDYMINVDFGDVAFIKAYNQPDHVIEVQPVEDNTIIDENAVDLDADDKPFSLRDAIKSALICVRDRHAIYDDTPVILDDEMITSGSLLSTLNAVDILVDRFYEADDQNVVKTFELTTMFAVTTQLRNNLANITDPVCQKLIASQLHVSELYFETNDFEADKYGITVPDNEMSQDTACWVRDKYKGTKIKQPTFTDKDLNLKNRLN